MPYLTPQPTIANVLATAAVWSGAGDTSGAMRLLNAHGLTVADMRSYLISKRGLLNGLGTAKPTKHQVPHPKATLARHARGDFTDPPPPYFAGMPLGQALGRFHLSNPFSAVTNAISAAAQKAKSAVSQQVMTAASMAVSLASGPPKSSAPAGSSGATYTDSSGNPISYFQYQQLMFQYNQQGGANGTAATATTAPGAVSTVYNSTNPNNGAVAVQPATPVYSASNLPASVNPANSAPISSSPSALPSSSDGSTGDNSGGGDTGYQDAASVFSGLGRFKHYAPRGVRALRPNPVVAGLGVAAPAPAAQPDIATQLNQISFDWPSGTLYVGTNKYSILTTLIGGLVVKTIMWGLSKGGNALKGAPALGGGAPAGKKGRA